MRQIQDLWHPENMHGQLTLQPGDDVAAAIQYAIRKFPKPAYTDIKYHVKPQKDGTRVVFFELEV